MMVAVKITVCWDVTNFSLVDMYDMSKKPAAFVIRIIHLPCRWRLQICLKCQYVSSRPYVVTFKMIVVFIGFIKKQRLNWLGHVESMA